MAFQVTPELQPFRPSWRTVIRITNQVDPALLAPAARRAEAFRQQPLYSIQGSVRQDGRKHASYNLANTCITFQAAIPRDRLRPAYSQGCRLAEDVVPPCVTADDTPGRSGHGQPHTKGEQRPQTGEEL